MPGSRAGVRRPARSAAAFHLVLSAALLSGVLAAATPPAQRTDPSRQRIVGTPATGVLVDLVVRDRHGALITDLDAQDVEVFEDGVPQSILTFELPRPDRSLVSSAEHREPSARPASTNWNGPRGGW